MNFFNGQTIKGGGGKGPAIKENIIVLYFFLFVAH